MPVLLLNWFAADSVPAQSVPYHGLGIYLKPQCDQVYKKARCYLNCSQVPGLYRIIRTKEEPGNTGRKVCTFLWRAIQGLEFMAGNSKQSDYMQISHFFSRRSNPPL